jgi:hypothetical protein
MRSSDSLYASNSLLLTMLGRLQGRHIEMQRNDIHMMRQGRDWVCVRDKFA